GIEPELPAEAGADVDAEAPSVFGPAPEALAVPEAEPLVAPGAESELPSETEAELRQIPADVRDEPFATPAHEVKTDELARKPMGASALGADEGTAAEHPTTVMQRVRMRVIDLHHLGRERVIGCWQIDDVLIDPGPASCL